MVHWKSPHFETGTFQPLQGHLKSYLVKSPGPCHVLNIDLEPADGISIGIHPSAKLTGETDSLGNSVLPQLKPGRYTLEVAAPGFRKENVTDIVVAIGQRAQVNVKLTLGAVTETVSVSGTAETVLAENASIGQVISSQSIVELPLNGRNFIQLA